MLLMNTVELHKKFLICNTLKENTRLLSGNAFGIFFTHDVDEICQVFFKPLNDSFSKLAYNYKNGILINFERELIEEDDIEYALDIMTLFNQSEFITIHDFYQTQKIYRVITMIRDEFKQDNASYIMIKTLLKVLLLHLIRFKNDRLLNQDLNQNRVYQFLELMESSFLSEQKTQFYANRIGISEKRLNQILKEKLNLTAKQIIQQRQITEAKRQLTKSDISVKELAFMLGFESLSSFSRFFKKTTGLSPSEYKTT